MHPDKGEATGGDRVKARPNDKSIRQRLIRTVLIPSGTLFVLWLVVSSAFVVNGLYVRAVAESVRQVSIPAVTALAALQDERELVLQYLDNSALAESRLLTQRVITDERLAALEAAFDSTIATAPAEIAGQVTALRSQFEHLPVLRTQIDVRSIDRTQVSAYYDGVLDAASNLFDTQARVVPDAQAALGGNTATAAFRAAEMMSRSSSLVAAALATGAFTPDAFVQFTEYSGYYRTQLAQVTPFLDPEVRVDLEALTAGTTWQQLAGAEDSLKRYGPWSGVESPDMPVSEADWQNLTGEVGEALNAIAVEQADRVSAAALDSGDRQLWNAILGSLGALLVAGVAVYIAVRVSRTLVDRTLMTRLAALRDDALDLANKRVPTIVRRIQRGERVVVEEELPRLDHGKDEIGQVAQAFNDAQLAAVNAAIGEAKARSGLNTVFLGIAKRLQTVTRKQLQLITDLEKNEENPEQLAALYRLDHLATRARRNGENLVILGGRQPRRGSPDPLPVLAVLRGAVSETEQYTRVSVDYEQVPDLMVTAAAVSDLVRVIAELLDNATQYSQPESQVDMSSRRVAHGVIVDIADAGLGMSEEMRQRANQMMISPPEFEDIALRAGESLGLFVVARLAKGRGFSVTFDRSRYGGTRATVLIDEEHLVETPGAEPRTVPAQLEDPEGVQVGATSPRRPRPSPAPRPRRYAPPTVPEIDVVPSPEPLEPGQAGHAGFSGQPGGRPSLPQRRPQEHLAAELSVEPDERLYGGGELPSGDGAAASLVAFHDAARLGRVESPDDDSWSATDVR